jgi:hypothetical protein
MSLTVEEQKEVDHYLTLSQEEKDSYLEENGVIILESSDEEDGIVKWTLDMKPEYHKALMSIANEGESIEDVLPRILKDFVENAKIENEKK